MGAVVSLAKNPLFVAAIVPGIIVVLTIRAAILWAYESWCEKSSSQAKRQVGDDDFSTESDFGVDAEDMEDDDLDAFIKDLNEVTREVTDLEDQMRKDMADVGGDFDDWMKQQGLTPAQDSAAAKRLRILTAIKEKRRVEIGGQGSSSRPAPSSNDGLRQRKGGTSEAKAQISRRSDSGGPPNSIRRAVEKTPGPGKTDVSSKQAAQPTGPQPDSAVVAAFEGSAFTAKWRAFQAERGGKPVYVAKQQKSHQ